MVDARRAARHSRFMPNRTKQQLLDRASELREMADAGDDLRLRQSLLQVAEEFEQEAAKLSDVDQAEPPQPLPPHK